MANMLAKENVAWWRTRRWWIQSLIALFFLNFFMALNLSIGGLSNAVNGFLLIAGVVAPVAAIIMGQDAIQGERSSGTAAWVLSKPIQRPAFVVLPDSAGPFLADRQGGAGSFPFFGDDASPRLAAC